MFLFEEWNRKIQNYNCSNIPTSSDRRIQYTTKERNFVRVEHGSVRLGFGIKLKMEPYIFSFKN